MIKKYFFQLLIVYLIPLFSLAQSNKIAPKFKTEKEEILSFERGFGIEFQSLLLFPTNFDEANPDLFDINTVWGFDAVAKYALDPYFQISVTTGYEKLSPVDISYIPLTFGLRAYTDESVKAAYVHADYGIHLGDVDGAGYIFRAGLGYRYPIFKQFAGTIELTFSMQNLQKNVIVNEEKYYFFRAFGLSAGFGIN
ncbi:MAG: hypothetical protein CO119_01655 [Flavobacteriales bacterium CG_4_9_14_3_um_filter_40_17]|nr:MAG: hypothetical protein CO119_01655 [Flavobacteriales bacterium CG_4_9_14_3_um_filter_40_17]